MDWCVADSRSRPGVSCPCCRVSVAWHPCWLPSCDNRTPPHTPRPRTPRFPFPNARLTEVHPLTCRPGRGDECVCVSACVGWMDSKCGLFCFIIFFPNSFPPKAEKFTAPANRLAPIRGVPLGHVLAWHGQGPPPGSPPPLSHPPSHSRWTQQERKDAWYLRPPLRSAPLKKGERNLFRLRLGLLEVTPLPRQPPLPRSQPASPLPLPDCPRADAIWAHRAWAGKTGI